MIVTAALTSRRGMNSTRTNTSANPDAPFPSSREALLRAADPVEATEEVIEDLISLAEDDLNIAAALDKLHGEDGGQAENGALDMLEQGNLNVGLEKIKQALQELKAPEAADPNLDLSYIKDLLALTAKSAAVDAIEQAEGRGHQAERAQKDPAGEGTGSPG